MYSCVFRAGQFHYIYQHFTHTMLCWEYRVINLTDLRGAAILAHKK